MPIKRPDTDGDLAHRFQLDALTQPDGASLLMWPPGSNLRRGSLPLGSCVVIVGVRGLAWLRLGMSEIES